MSAPDAPDEKARIEKILAAVEAARGPGEANWLAMRIGAQPALRAVRIVQRDELVRRAFQELDAATPTRAAKILADAIKRRMGDFGNKPPEAGSLDALVDQVIALNSWRPLGWRQIHNIFSDRLCNRAEENCKAPTL